MMGLGPLKGVEETRVLAPAQPIPCHINIEEISGCL